MREQRRRWIQVLLALLFVSVGVGLGLALRPAGAEPAAMAGAYRDPRALVPAADTPQGPALQPPAQLVRDPAQEARIQALEQKVAELTSRSAAVAPAPVSPPSRPDPEELKQVALQQQQARLDAHQRQSIDPAWSPEATRSFSTDFSTLAQGQQFTVKSIDCRSTSCIAKVEWPSFAEAAASYQVLLQHAYGMDCTRSLLLPEPEDSTRAYEAPLILDCQNLRR